MKMLEILVSYYTRECKSWILCKPNKNKGALCMHLWKIENNLDNGWKGMVF